jgi:hypothetical protein
MQTYLELILKPLIEAVLVSGILGYFFLKRDEKIKKTIEEEFKKRDVFFNAQFNFKLRALEELLAPIKLQMIRSKIAFKNYELHDAYREKILKECNEVIRGLILEKGFLIPSDLLTYAEKLISHYDDWLQAYQQALEVQHDNHADGFVFTCNFPHDAEEAFLEKYEAYRNELKIEASLK